MSFFSDSFKKIAKKTPIDKAVGSAISYSISSLGKDIGDKLFSIGSSGSVIGKIAGLTSDALLSGASDEFFNNLGTATSRVAAKDLTLLRDASSLSGNTHAATVSPEGKMGPSAFNNISYPPDLGEYFISFEIVNYQRPTPFKTANWESLCTLQLPIPHELNESHEVSWRDGDTGFVGAVADAYSKYKDGQGTETDMTGAIAQGAVNYGLRYISPDAFGTVGQFAGGIPNPNMSMFFEGPTFQEHQFTWTFAPQSAEESLLVKNMFKQFKIAQLPSAALKGAANILNYPKAVQMRLHAGDSEADYLYKVKKAVITACNINYAPNGHPQFFKGTKAPKYIQFSIRLKAIEYFLAEDFDSSLHGLGGNWGEALEDFGDVATKATKSIFKEISSKIGG